MPASQGTASQRSPSMGRCIYSCKAPGDPPLLFIGFSRRSGPKLLNPKMISVSSVLAKRGPSGGDGRPHGSGRLQAFSGLEGRARQVAEGAVVRYRSSDAGRGPADAIQQFVAFAPALQAGAGVLALDALVPFAAAGAKVLFAARGAGVLLPARTFRAGRSPAQRRSQQNSHQRLHQRVSVRIEVRSPWLPSCPYTLPGSAEQGRPLTHAGGSFGSLG